MKYLPKLFLLSSLILAAWMLLPEPPPPAPQPPEIQHYQPPSLQLDERGAESDMPSAAAQSGGLEFVPSEQIGAGRAVDFPADI